MSFEAGLLTILVKMRVIAAEDALSIEQSFHDSDVDQFDDFLLSEGIVDEENLLEALSEYFQVPAFDVVGYFFERHYLRMFPKDTLLRNVMIPLEVEENIMIVVTSRPNNPELLVEIGENVSYDIQFYVGIGRNICDAIKEYYDKSETEVDMDEDRNEENILMGEFHFLEVGEEDLVLTVDDEDKFE